MNPHNQGETTQYQPTDPYEEILFRGYTEVEIAEIKILMKNWDKAINKQDINGFDWAYVGKEFLQPAKKARFE